MVGRQIEGVEAMTTVARSAAPVFKAYGASIELLTACEPEILYEGPANTGKSRTLLEKCYMLANEFPGMRQLWVRKTRKSMTESVLVTWEEHVLPANHPCISGPSRAQRDFYDFPNGTRIVLGGMDNPDRIMSTEYDFVAYFEATEGEQDEWEKLGTRIRNKKIPVGVDRDGEGLFWDQMVADCNPSHSNHWLNKRALDGKMRRIRARHCDNPVFTKRDQARLDALTGARRARLRDGLWVSAEGQILSNYDPAKHHTRLDQWLLDPEEPSAGLKFDWYGAGLDFGYRHAQALEVFGMIGETAVLIGEVYRREMRPDWWAGALERVIDKYDLQIIVADGADLTAIHYLNDRLGPLGGRDEGDLIRAAVKRPGYKQSNLQMMQDHLAQGRLLFAEDAQLEERCGVCREQFKPQSILEEIPDFRWAELKDGQRAREEPDPRCVDHGIDAAQMFLGWLWGTDLTPKWGPKYAPGSYGAELDHETVLENDARLLSTDDTTAPDEHWPDEDIDDLGYVN